MSQDHNPAESSKLLQRFQAKCSVICSLASWYSVLSKSFLDVRLSFLITILKNFQFQTLCSTKHRNLPASANLSSILQSIFPFPRTCLVNVLPYVSSLWFSASMHPWWWFPQRYRLLLKLLRVLFLQSTRFCFKIQMIPKPRNTDPEPFKMICESSEAIFPQ